MASDSWRYPWTKLPDYQGPGTPVEQYERKRLAQTEAPAMAQPSWFTGKPDTVNAVSAATDVSADQPAYPTEFRRGYDAAAAAKPATSVASTALKLVNNAEPYPDLTSRFRGMDSAGIDFGASRAGGGGGLPRFQAAPAMSLDMGGMFAPDVQSQIDDYGARASTALSGRGIVDNWRGRQYLKARSRLIRGATETSTAQTGRINAGVGAFNANTNAMRAANEVPLAMMGDVTQRRGQDLRSSEAAMHDRTSRYGINVGADERRYATDVGAESSRRSAEMGFLPHLPDFVLGMQRNKYVEQGDIESAHKLGTIGRADPRPVAPRIDFNPQTGAMVISHPDGRVETKTVEQQNQDALLAAQAKARTEEARKFKGQ